MDFATVFLALFSGAAGALIAQSLSFWAERVKLRGETALRTIEWTDEVYFRIIDLAMQKKAAYTGSKDYLTPEDYSANTRAVRTLLLQGAIPARIAVAYGYGEEMGLVNELRARLLEAARALWAAKRETWAQDEPKVARLFAEAIDPLRETLDLRLLHSGSIPLLWKPPKKPNRTPPRWTMGDGS